MDQRMIIVGKMEGLVVAISVIVVALCGLLIFAVVSGSVTERKREIGIFRAIGFSSGFITWIVLGEYLILGIVAGFVGISATLAIARPLASSLPGLPAITVDFRVLAIGFLSLVILGLLASLMPARKAAGIDPVRSINSL